MCVYVTALDGVEERPMFVQIIRIVRKDTQWMLLADHLITKSYNDHLCAWEIETVHNLSFIDSQHLTFHHRGLDIYYVNQSSYVCLSSRLTNWNHRPR